MADVQTPVEVAPAKIEEVVDEVVVTEEKQVILCNFLVFHICKSWKMFVNTIFMNWTLNRK